jgi:hypothetical protein
MLNDKQPEERLCDRLMRKAMEGQSEILDEMLNAGISLIYQDEQGNMMQKNPDGSIEPYRE